MKKEKLVLIALIVLIIVSVCIVLWNEHAQNTPKTTDVTKTSSPKPSPSPIIDHQNADCELVDLYPIQNFNKYGYVDSYGNIKIDPVFDYAYEFHSGLARVIFHNEHKTCYIDKTGEIIISGDSFDYVGDFIGNYAVVKDLDGNKFIIDRNGNEIIKLCYQDIRNICNGIFAVKNNSKWGLVNTSGTYIKEHIFDEIGNFSEGLLAIKMDGKWGYINTAGIFIIKPSYDYADIFSEGLAVVSENGEARFIDKNGKLLCNKTFENAREFNEGYAAVKVAGEWGYIDINGTIVIDPQFLSVYGFDNGIAKVWGDDYQGVINKKGEFILKKKNEDISCERGYIFVCDYRGYYEGKIEGNIYDKKGKVLLHNPMACFSFVEGDVANKNLLKKFYKDRLSYIDIEGNVIWEQNNKIKLDNGTVIQEQIIEDKTKFLYYPQVYQPNNISAQNQINEYIKNVFEIDKFYKEKEWNTRYKLEYYNSNILSLNIYILGLSRKYDGSKNVSLVFNLKTGSVFTLGDLFKKNSDYQKKIENIIKKQAEDKWDNIEVDFENLNMETNFCILKDGILIPAMTKKAKAWSEFYIPFSQIDNLIDKEGSLWRSTINESVAF